MITILLHSVIIIIIVTSSTFGFRIPSPPNLMIPPKRNPTNPANNLQQQRYCSTTRSRLFLFRNNNNSNNKQYTYRSIVKRTSTTTTTTSTSIRAISDGSPIPYFPNENNNDDSNNDDSIDVNSTSSSFYFSATKGNRNNSNEPGTSSSTKSLREIIDDLGRAVKEKAIETAKQAKSLDVINNSSPTNKDIKSTKFKKYYYVFQSCILYTIFIIYRGYRGFFVILPAVFKETFRKLESSIEPAPFDEDNNTNTNNSNDTTIIPRNDTIISWRVRIVVSILSSIVVATYVVSGLARVVVRMIQTLRNKKDPSESFAAAADEQELNEKKLYNKLIKK